MTPCLLILIKNYFREISRAEKYFLKLAYLRFFLLIFDAFDEGFQTFNHPSMKFSYIQYNKSGVEREIKKQQSRHFILTTPFIIFHKNLRFHFYLDHSYYSGPYILLFKTVPLKKTPQMKKSTIFSHFRSSSDGNHERRINANHPNPWIRCMLRIQRSVR